MLTEVDGLTILLLQKLQTLELLTNFEEQEGEKYLEVQVTLNGKLATLDGERYKEIKSEIQDGSNIDEQSPSSDLKNPSASSLTKSSPTKLNTI